MYQILNPIIGILYNDKLKRWHPIVFREAPMPGSPDVDKPVRHKSAGHHTIGFETREAAIEHINSRLLPELQGGRTDIAQDFPWDGEGIPAIVHFFGPPSNETQ